jgi:hypothetical protein
MNKESFAIFVDNSGSVSGCASYWQTVSEVLVQYAKDITYYFFWGSECQISSKKQFEETILNKRGAGGGTRPETVAQTIVNNKFINFILITDG